MRNQVIASIFVALAALFGGATTADAAKMPIPCTGDKIVRVAELPTHVAAGNGQRLGLGYLYTGCFSGRWIGHVGSDQKYSDKAGPLLLIAMTAANNGVVPNEPSLVWGLWNYPWQFFVEWLWLFALGVIVVEISKNLLRYGTIENPHNVAALRAAAEARQQHAASPLAPPTSAAAMPALPEKFSPAAPATSARRAPRDLRVSVAGGQGRPAFGKRG